VASRLNEVNVHSRKQVVLDAHSLHVACCELVEHVLPANEAFRLRAVEWVLTVDGFILKVEQQILQQLMSKTSYELSI